MPKSFTKQPSENKDYEFDWTDWMPSGDSVSSAVVVATPSGLTLGSKTLGSVTVTQFISGGTDNTDYKVTCTMTTVEGRIDEREIFILVREL